MLCLVLVVENKKLFCVVNKVNVLDDFCRNAADNTIGGNVFHDNCVCTDNAVATNGDTAYDFGSGTNQHVVSDYGAFVAIIPYCHLLHNLAVTAYSVGCYDCCKAMLY